MMTSAARDERSVLDSTFAGTKRSLATSRHAVADATKSLGLPQDMTELATLVVSELTTNAVEASPDQPYRVRIGIDDEAVVIKVGNRTPAASFPRAEEWGPESLLAPRGRGLAIVDAVASAVDVVETEPGWTEVTARIERSVDDP